MKWNLNRLALAIARIPIEPGSHTNWSVLTGAPSSGKSTLLRELSNRRIATRPEQARLFFEGKLAEGHTLPSLTSDPAALVREIFNRNASIQQATDREEMIVFDRSLPDVLAFGLIDGVDITEYIRTATRRRFKVALLLEQIPQTRDSLVYHTPKQLNDVEQACETIYRAMGTKVVRVPLFASQVGISLLRRSQFAAQQILAA